MSPLSNLSDCDAFLCFLREWRPSSGTIGSENLRVDLQRFWFFVCLKGSL